MNAYASKEEIALMMPSGLTHYSAASLTQPPMPASDRPGLVQRLADGLRWLVELPRRRALLSELDMLSDHELADIGLNRAELARVFEPGFAAQRSQSVARSRGHSAHA